MLSDLSDWNVGTIADGFVMCPPTGREDGILIMRERKSPLIAFDELTRAALARLAPQASVGPVDQFASAEGEYAALAAITGSAADGKPFEANIGVIYGDDFYHSLETLVHKPASFETFRRIARELLFSTTLGLGHQRRRRFLYQPPQGWTGLARALLAEWYPAQYPSDDSTIWVSSAWPLRMPLGSRGEVFVLQARLKGLGPPTKKEVVVSDYGLTGAWVTHELAERMIDQVVFRDDGFLYNLRMDSARAMHALHRETFMKLVRSCQPIPHETRTDHDLFKHWLDE